MTAAEAHAKINLGLVVGPPREDGKHEVVTLLQRIELSDTIAIEAHATLEVGGFQGDTLVSGALAALARAAGVAPAWRALIEKRIPVAAGLGGGSSDAATALLLANGTLAEPLTLGALHDVAMRLGADVPFFLGPGTQLATADGTELRPVALPLDYEVLLVRPHVGRKESTRVVYEEFDLRDGAAGFAERRTRLLSALTAVRNARDLALLPRNDLASSPLAGRLEELGAFRADVSGAGPTLYALFDDHGLAASARDALAEMGETWLTRPVAP